MCLLAIGLDPDLHLDLNQACNKPTNPNRSQLPFILFHEVLGIIRPTESFAQTVTIVQLWLHPLP